MKWGLVGLCLTIAFPIMAMDALEVYELEKKRDINGKPIVTIMPAADATTHEIIPGKYIVVLPKREDYTGQVIDISPHLFERQILLDQIVAAKHLLKEFDDVDKAVKKSKK